MNETKEKLSQSAKPIGFWGRIIARLMAIAHRTIYKNVAAALNMQPEDDYLEVGCGSGIFMKSYVSHVRSIAGLDHSKDMVKVASHYNRKRIEAGTAEFRHGDAAQLPWEDEKFSATAAIGTFLFWLEPLESLKEIHRVLRSGGRLVISLGWNADDGLNHTKHVKKYGIKLYTGKEMQAMFQEVGFSESSITYSKGFMMPKLMIACAKK
ncbi:putative arsenite methyltransferase [ANME-1 cluster archaeon GoMg1]|nr:putative arsenite methyltransferase [ANME-1 cluster archaeon GoMg1]